MDELRIRLLIDALKVLNDTADFDDRESFKNELAKELKVSPLCCESDAAKRLVGIEEHFDRVCDEKENLKEAIRLISESF